MEPTENFDLSGKQNLHLIQLVDNGETEEHQIHFATPPPRALTSPSIPKDTFTEVKPQAGHKCTLCGKSLSDRMAFNLHIKKHLKEKLNKKAEKLKFAESLAKPSKKEPPTEIQPSNLVSPIACVAPPPPLQTTPKVSTPACQAPQEQLQVDVMAELRACQPLPRDSDLIKDHILHPSPSLAQTQASVVILPPPTPPLSSSSSSSSSSSPSSQASIPTKRKAATLLVPVDAPSDCTPDISDMEEDFINYNMELNRIDFNQDLSSILNQIEQDFGKQGMSHHHPSVETPPDSDVENTDYLSGVIDDISLDIDTPLISNTNNDLLGFDKFSKRIMQHEGENGITTTIPLTMADQPCPSAIILNEPSRELKRSRAEYDPRKGRVIGIVQNDKSQPNQQPLTFIDPTMPQSGQQSEVVSQRSNPTFTVEGGTSLTNLNDHHPLIRSALTGPPRVLSRAHEPTPDTSTSTSTLRGKLIQQSAASVERVGHLPAKALAILSQLPPKLFRSSAGSPSRLVNVVKVERSSYPAGAILNSSGIGSISSPNFGEATVGLRKSGMNISGSNTTTTSSPFTVINIECHETGENGEISGKIIETYKAIDTGREIKLLSGDPYAQADSSAIKAPHPQQQPTTMISQGERLTQSSSPMNNMSLDHGVALSPSPLNFTMGLKVPKHRCHDCNLSFSTKDEFFFHIRNTHRLSSIAIQHGKAGSQCMDLEENPKKLAFPCTKCERSFPHRVALVRHERSIHGRENELTCKVCSKQCKNKLSLIRHRSKHLACLHCSKGFSNKVALQEHLLQMHQASAILSVERPLRSCSPSSAPSTMLETSITSKRGDNFLFNPDDLSVDESMDSDDCFSLSSRNSIRPKGGSSIGGGDSMLSEVEEDDIFMLDQRRSPSSTLGDSLADISNANFFDITNELGDEFGASGLF
ncbi:uncharacterized protein LOC131889578 [Tigriopus californicus]|uniref:uncharacterized protein LOC131889578 n=1 Tax=Tigriopus californicus TaxID=6832 RepID=UPI0027D9ED07|nr:uncharacterized protein LOC131889578 [Tigriopus californicus]